MFEALLEAGDVNHSLHLGESTAKPSRAPPTQAEIAAAAAVATAALAAAEATGLTVASSAADANKHYYLAKQMEPVSCRDPLRLGRSPKYMRFSDLACRHPATPRSSS